MNPREGLSVTAGSPSVKDRWELAKRVASSPLFERSARLREFLLYVCDCALNGRAEGVNEHQIGQAVFGRLQEYNPAVDNIVRVEARHLRAKLASYFETIGKDEPIIISIPKGSYLPVFEPRSSAPILQPGDGNPEPAPGARPDMPLRPKLGRELVLAGLAILFAVTTAWFAYRNISLKRQLGPEESRPEESRQAVRDLPWAAVFDPNHRTSVVLADSCLAFLQDIARRPVQFGEYINRDYLSQEELPADLRPILQLFMSRQYTSIADAGLVGQIVRLSRGFQDKLNIKYARNIDIRDFKHDHMILLGSTRSDPWVELFERHMNFRFQFNHAAATVAIQSMQPLPGEQREYVAAQLPGNENYSVIALMPNLGHTGNVLIIEGTSMEGTEAAGDFLASPQFASRVLRTLRWKPGAPPAYFELLVKSRQIGGSSSDTEVVSLRMAQ